ncbi:hypothetical protein WN48_11156 [Eufriesea mexicana]|uniref:Uncharacterized protein n=1 Tax=Eufriesea mexicana TaxID=516756 RepID=A0A310SH62_9HYME|nr:hypothetical protein WN48_11156 [Eufriesea mexicana]
MTIALVTGTYSGMTFSRASPEALIASKEQLGQRRDATRSNGITTNLCDRLASAPNGRGSREDSGTIGGDRLRLQLRRRSLHLQLQLQQRGGCR